MKTSIPLLLTLAVLSVSGATLRVSKTPGNGIFPTINDAIGAAKASDTIEIGPGLYSEAVVVNKSLTLQGAGPQFVIIQSPVLAPAIKSTGGGSVPKVVHITGLTAIAPQRYALDVEPNQSVNVRNCILANSIHGLVSSIGSENDARIHLENCTFAHNRSYAVYYYDVHANNGSLSLYNCIFYQNGITDDVNVLYTSVGTFAQSHNLNFGPQQLGVTMNDLKNTDPKFIAPLSGNFLLQNDSPARNAGWEGPGFVDPDGSRNDLGAYGGPGAAAFWPYPANGPVIGAIDVSTASPRQGDKVRIRATGTTR